MKPKSKSGKGSKPNPKGKNNRDYKRGNSGSQPDRRYSDERYSKDPGYSGKDERSSGLNDLSWYTKYPELIVGAASYPYPYRAGSLIKAGSLKNGSGVAANVSIRVPGVMVGDWMPYLGISNAATDPASLVGREIYARVRSKYSGALDADAPDFVIYLMALDSCYAYIAHLKRIYRILTAYSPNNHVLPNGLLMGIGLTSTEIDDLVSHRTKLWQNVNELVHMVSKFTAPEVMDIFKRHYWMSDNVYTDAASINSQFYMFNLVRVLQYSEVDTPDGVPAAGLTMQSVPLTKGSNDGDYVDTLFKFGKGLIDSLVAWDDAYTINGYLMRAYEGVNFFRVDLLGQDEQLVPVYVEEVLTQIENSSALEITGTYKFLDTRLEYSVSQDPKSNSILSQATVTFNNTMYYVNGAMDGLMPIMSIRSDAPTAGDNVIASRLKCLYEQKSVGSDSVTYNVIAGTELLLRWRIVSDGTISQYATSGSQLPPIMVSEYPVEADAEPFPMTDAINGRITQNTLAWLSQFDWHPLVWSVAYYQAGNKSWYYTATINGDIHNVTVVTKDQVKELHRICTLSEFAAYTLI